jgi:hypothetical protein
MADKEANGEAGAVEAAREHLARLEAEYERAKVEYERIRREDGATRRSRRDATVASVAAAASLGLAILGIVADLSGVLEFSGFRSPLSIFSAVGAAAALAMVSSTATAVAWRLMGRADQDVTRGDAGPGNWRVQHLTQSVNLAHAVAIGQVLADDLQRVLGPDHPNTLASRSNLAGVYVSAGELGKAIGMFEAVLADRVRVLGPDHPDTLASRSYLAGVYVSAGQLDKAIPLYEATLADCERILPPGHPLTSMVRSNLRRSRG